MLTKEELKEKKLTFWNDFKQLMSKVKSSNGKRMSWLSYPTDIKNIYLRLYADKKEIALNFDIQYKDPTIRAVFWEQLNELKRVLESEMNEEGIWIEKCNSDSVEEFCRIQWKKENLNYLNDAHKEEIYAFFKEKLIAFDSFYQEYKDILIFLAK